MKKREILLKRVIGFIKFFIGFVILWIQGKSGNFFSHEILIAIFNIICIIIATLLFLSGLKHFNKDTNDKNSDLHRNKLIFLITSMFTFLYQL